MTEAEALKETLTSVYRRCGGEGQYTHVFGEFEPSLQRSLVELAGVGDDELPILGGLEAPTHWFLLTSSRIVWREAETTTTLALDKILDATVSLDGFRQAGLRKAQWRELRVVTDDGVHVITAEPGSPFFALWNVLKSIGTSNRHRRGGTPDP
jgi:hypothetical protein